MLEADYILHLWLGNVPSYSDAFLRIILMSCMVNALANSSTVAAGATGNIKTYSIVVGGTVLIPLPVAYVVLHFIEKPESVFWVVLFFEVLALYLRLLFMRKMVYLSLSIYFKKVILPVIGVVVSVIIPPVLLHNILEQSFINVVFMIGLSFLLSLLAVYIIGLSNNERSFVLKTIKSKVLHKE